MPKTFEDVLHQLSVFNEERDWSRFHTPRNLVLALVGEVGELAERKFSRCLRPAGVRRLRVLRPVVWGSPQIVDTVLSGLEPRFGGLRAGGPQGVLV
ncbi:hypothetical protein ACH9EU_16820, partial [Kocuria sp. M1R5S2]